MTTGSGAGDPDETRGRSSVDHAYAVETVVVEEHGQWAVDIVVVFGDEVVRKRIDTYRTEALARIHADLIRRAAERDIRGPIHG